MDTRRAPPASGTRRRGSVRFIAPLARLALAALAPLATTAACTRDVAAHTATNPGASFEQYRTFSFGATEGPPAGYPVSLEVRRRLQPLIAASLGQKGYRPSSAKGDFFIMIGSGVRAAGPSGEEEWLPDDENADFVERALVIDAFDAATGTRVWHGAARSDELDGPTLDRSVRRLMASFPTTSTRVE